jgi:Glyoxalase/Bleomycin resistance protein/Dioxygenase superfamily
MMQSSNLIRQNAFIVEDLDEAACRWARSFKIGPFFCLRHLKFDEIRYRGASVDLDISLALAFSGDLNIELIEQHNDGPSAYRDVYPKGCEGFHHVLVYPDEFDVEVARYADLGFQTAMTGVSKGGGLRFAYIDTHAELGFMLEIVSGGAPLPFWQPMIEAARRWNGIDGPIINVVL